MYILGIVQIAVICFLIHSRTCKVHQCLHNGKLPYRCDIRNKTFSDPSTLNKYHPSKLGYVCYIYSCYICRTFNSVNILLCVFVFINIYGTACSITME